MNPYLNRNKLKCIVLCAGRGTRICPSLKEEPKDMILFKNRPLLDYVMDYWKEFTQEFIFVVGYKKEKIIKYVKHLPIQAAFTEQKSPKGIADAIYCARDLAGEHFVVALGDCLCRGEFTFPEDMVQGVGVYKASEPKQIRESYSLKIKDNLIVEVKEKPKVLPNNLCGMGFYFFERRVFDYIKHAKPSTLRNEIEITDVIQTMIDNKEMISPVFFKGAYVNVNYLKDIQKIETIF